MSLYSQVLLLPLGGLPMPVPAFFTCSHSHDSEVWGVLTATVAAP